MFNSEGPQTKYSLQRPRFRNENKQIMDSGVSVNILEDGVNLDLRSSVEHNIFDKSNMFSNRSKVKAEEKMAKMPYIPANGKSQLSLTDLGYENCDESSRFLRRTTLQVSFRELKKKIAKESGVTKLSQDNLNMVIRNSFKVHEDQRK